jgi:acyl carrier protein phosphodiesterase
MNFLAHIFLSGDDSLIKIGNFMADGIRGKDYEQYPPKLKIGILLHRFIDSYTDSHPIFKQSTKKLHPNYGHYSGVLIDMFYDHFLCKNWKKYSSENLSDFVQNFYASLRESYPILTEKTQHLLPYMEQGNWLYNYQFIDELELILTQMDHRTKYASKMRFAKTELLLYYDEFEKEFTDFFEEIQTQAKIKLTELLAEHSPT